MINGGLDRWPNGWRPPQTSAIRCDASSRKLAQVSEPGGQSVTDRLAALGPDDDHAVVPMAEVAAVQRANQASWQISIDQPQPLVIGLFIRDVSGMHSRNNWLPPASPAVPSGGDWAPDVAGLQWDRWWSQALREEYQADDADWPPDLSSWWTPPEFESLDASPELQAIVAAHFFDAVRWSDERHQEHRATMRGSRGLLETKLVRDLERALARTARPFHLRITEIPVHGQHLWQLQPDHILVSAALLRDTAQYRQNLLSVVEALF
jgi:hypothetical protein